MEVDVKKEEKEETKTTALSPIDEIDRLFDTFFSRGLFGPARWEWPSWSRKAMAFEGKMPQVDIIDQENEIKVKAELPGVKKEDLDISLTENTLTIKGTTESEEREEEGNYYRCEISRGSYARSLTLPAAVDADKAKATLKDGVLELSLPKKEPSKGNKITVE